MEGGRGGREEGIEGGEGGRQQARKKGWKEGRRMKERK
jgi:hypothetical protein